MTEYYLFLDESNPNGKTITYFCLAGYIVSEKEYVDGIIPKVNALKQTTFDKTDIILHETDIRKAEGIFACMTNSEIRDKFWNGIHNVFIESDIKIVGACVSENISKTIYKSKNVNSNYSIALQIVLENFVYFLEQNNAKGTVIIESSTSKIQLTNLYHTIVSNGTLFLEKNVFQKHLTSINFYIKADNNIGLQVADFIPNPINRNFSGMKQKPYSLFKILNEKLYDGSVNKPERFGLKIIE